MDNRYHNGWDRDNFYYHRKDPRPWIPITDVDDGKWKFKEWALAVVLMLVLAFAVGYTANVKADVLAQTANNAGGKIVITDVKCSTGAGSVAYSTHPKSETLLGCWVHDTSFIHILWSGNTNPNSYPLTGWELVKKQAPNI